MLKISAKIRGSTVGATLAMKDGGTFASRSCKLRRKILTTMGSRKLKRIGVNKHIIAKLGRHNITECKVVTFSFWIG